MICACRTSSLRAFVRSITSVQLPAAKHLSTLPSPQAKTWPRPAENLQTETFSSTRTSSRGLHGTSPARTDATEGVLAEAQFESQRDTAQLDHGFEPRNQERSAETGADAASRHLPSHSSRPQNLKFEKEREHPWRTARSAEGNRIRAQSDAPYKQRGRSGDAPRDSASPQERRPKTREEWKIQKAALKEKFPDGWNPKKKLSPDALAGIRALHQQFPEDYPTEVLAQKFEVSPEAIRRILKSKWQPKVEEEIDRQERWFERGKRIWTAQAELGVKPPVRWRKEGITRDPSWHERKKRAHAEPKPDERRHRPFGSRKLKREERMAPREANTEPKPDERGYRPFGTRKLKREERRASQTPPSQTPASDTGTRVTSRRTSPRRASPRRTSSRNAGKNIDSGPMTSADFDKIFSDTSA